MATQTERGTGRPDTKMSQNEDATKRARFGVGSRARKQVQAQANSKRRQRDRSSSDGSLNDPS